MKQNSNVKRVACVLMMMKFVMAVISVQMLVMKIHQSVVRL